MKPITLYLGLALTTLTTLTTTHAQTLDAFFSPTDLAHLDELITAAQANNPEVLQATAQIDALERTASLEGRLAESLNIQAGANLNSNLYDQASPSYSISVSIDIMGLVEAGEGTTRRLLDIQLETAQAQARVAAVEAFVTYKVATNNAEAAARNVEAAEAAFQVSAARYNVGDTILANQIQAQTAVADAAVNLLSANGQVIVALEQLASVTGLTPSEVANIVTTDTRQANNAR
jgi:outer membrane protein TolC